MKTRSLLIFLSVEKDFACQDSTLAWAKKANFTQISEWFEFSVKDLRTGTDILVNLQYEV